jgi:hypothetical protein
MNLREKKKQELTTVLQNCTIIEKQSSRTMNNKKETHKEESAKCEKR